MISCISKIPETIINTFMYIKLFSIMLIEKYIIQKRWYIIEGNIGCGKTTLIRNLKKSGNYEVIEEPLEEWKNIKNEDEENILGLFYKDGKKYAYLFQTIVFKSRIKSLDIEQTKAIRFSERSIWTDKNIFSKNCYEMGLMNTVEKSTYDFWFEWLESKIKRMPDGIIYLRACPDVCLDRMKKRDRLEENTVSLDYLTKIHEKHEIWLNNTKYNTIPIYIVENSVEPEESLKKVIEIIKKDTSIWSVLNGKFSVKKFQEFLRLTKICILYFFHVITRRKFINLESVIGKEYYSIDVYYRYILLNILLINVPMFIYYVIFN